MFEELPPALTWDGDTSLGVGHREGDLPRSIGGWGHHEGDLPRPIDVVGHRGVEVSVQW